MTSSERPSPEPILKKEASPAVLGGGDISGNALEASNALNYRAWGIPAVLLRRIPGNALRVFPGSFRNSSGISSGKSQPYWGWPILRQPIDQSQHGKPKCRNARQVNKQTMLGGRGEGEGGLRGARRGGGASVLIGNMRGRVFKEGLRAGGCLRRIGEFLGGGGG